MLTRIEIDGFKTFENFELDLQPFSSIVGPNASGKSNLFDALKFLSLLAQTDVRTAMLSLRGDPEELFRQTEAGSSGRIAFAVEALLDQTGADAFGTKYSLKAQRIRYELDLTLKTNARGQALGVFVARENCAAIAKTEDKALFLKPASIVYSKTKSPFIRMREAQEGEATAFEIRQDGPASEAGASKRGRPVTLPAVEASRSALSTITTAEFPHLYALKQLFVSTRFLEINPQAARRANDRFEEKTLRSDASNLAAVLARLREETGVESRPDGVIADISIDLASLIPSVQAVKILNDVNAKEYSFGIFTSDRLHFSARVISDGTLRLLALLAVLDDPDRKGILCFEEPENGVHEGRIQSLVALLRDAASTAASVGNEPLFQILINTHSPAVMSALNDNEIVAADMVTEVEPSTNSKTTKTRMRTGVQSDRLNFATDLSRNELESLLRRPGDAA